MSSACVGHEHHRWPRVLAQSGGQSRHRHSAGDNVLTLQRPGDEVGAEEHSVAQGGPACIRATHPIYISVDRQLRGSRASQEKSIIQGGRDVDAT
jgi:hypothetical protein